MSGSSYCGIWTPYFVTVFYKEQNNSGLLSGDFLVVIEIMAPVLIAKLPDQRLVICEFLNYSDDNDN